MYCRKSLLGRLSNLQILAVVDIFKLAMWVNCLKMQTDGLVGNKTKLAAPGYVNKAAGKRVSRKKIVIKVDSLYGHLFISSFKRSLLRRVDE